MQTGRVQQPFISEQVVRDSLDSLVRQTSKQATDSPLQFLTLIDLQLTDPSFPLVQRARQFVLQKLLTQIITERYIHHLHMFDLETSGYEELSHSNVYTAAHRITADILRGTSELIGWSFLFYHYVRVDLGISPQIYCRMGNMEERTLRRYQQHAVRRLTEILIAKEWEARKGYFVRLLLSLLPYPENTVLIDRTEALNHMQQEIEGGGRQHLLITGASGIGKTALLSGFLNKVIEQGNIDKLVWISAPLTADEVRLKLRQDLLLENPRMLLGDFFAIWRTFIVLDGIETLQENLIELTELLKDLRDAVVLVSSSIFILFPEVSQLSLKELSYSDIKIILQSEYNLEANQDFEWHANKVWELVGGNPLAAKIVSRHLQFFGYSSTPTTFGLELIYDHIYRALGEKVQYAWLALAIVPIQSIAVADLKLIWQGFRDPDLINELSARHLIETRSLNGSTIYKLPASAHQFIVSLYRADSQVKIFIDGLIAELGTPLEGGFVTPVEIIENILTISWLEIESSLRRDWVAAYFQKGIQARHFAIWAKLLQPYIETLSNSTLRFAVAYGTVMRHLCNWIEAKAVIDRVIEFTGEKGLFQIQSEALLELVKLLRFQGDYIRVIELLARLDTFPSQKDNNDLLIERIQIEMEAGELSRVGELLKNIPLNDIAFNLLRAEYLLRTSQHEVLNELSSNFILHEHIDYTYLARLHILLGNSNEQQEKLDAACDHFYIALTILEREGIDHFAIARTKTNLAAIILQQGLREEARTLLNDGQQTQTRLHDRVGLAATRHNLRLLDQGFIS